MWILKKLCPLQTSERSLLYFTYAFDKSLPVPFKLKIATLISQQITKEFNEKSCMKTRPLDETQELHTWLHQTNEQNPTTSKDRLEFTYNYFHLSLFTKPAPLRLLLLLLLLIWVHVFFSCALSNWQVSDCDRHLYKKCLKLSSEVF